MSYDDDFNDLIKQKFQNRKFEFDENKWDKVEELIEAGERENKRRLRFWMAVPALILLTVGLGVLIYFNSPVKNNAKQQIAEVKTQNNNLDLNNTANSVKPAVAEDNNVSADIANKNANPLVAEEKINPGTKTEIVASKINKIETKTTVTEKKVIAKENTTNKISKTEMKNNSSPIKSKIISRKQKSQNNFNPQNNTIHQNGNAIVEMKFKKNGEVKQPIISLEEKPESGNNQTEITTLLNQTPSTDINTDNLKSVAMIASETEITSIVTKKASVSTAVVNQSVTAQVAKPIVDAITSWHFSLGAGVNYATDFSINPIAGFEVSKAFSPLFELGTGLYYTYLSTLSGNVKTFTLNTSYDFGYSSELSEIKTDKVHYMVLPVYTRFNINARNSIIFGANFFYMFTTSNKVTNCTESYSVRRNSSTTDEYGYSSGFNNLDAGIMLGYKLKLFAHLGVQLSFNYGLMDIKKDSYYYNENKFDRNISGQLMLTYNLFK